MKNLLHWQQSGAVPVIFERYKRMNVKSLVEFFGSEELVCMFFKLKNHNNLRHWETHGVPLGRQYEAEVRTGGRLRVNRMPEDQRMDALLLEAAGKTEVQP